MNNKNIIKPIRFVNNTEDISSNRKEVARFSIYLKFVKLDLGFFNKNGGK